MSSPKGSKIMTQSPSARPSVSESILIMDFGSQYSRLIARRIREANVYCELISPHTEWETVSKLNAKGVILSGGPASVYSSDAPIAPDWVYSKKLPVLGICYGMQLLTSQMGGSVEPAKIREYGHAKLMHDADHPILKGITNETTVWMSHGDRVTKLPEGFKPLAHTLNSSVAIMGNNNNMIGLQFHPEVAHTQEGSKLLNNFLFDICKCTGDWTPGNFVTQAIEDLRNTIGTGKVICALSGGVDSAVVATLIHRAVGTQLTSIFVDNGLLRKDEAIRVQDMFAKHFDMKIIHVKAEDEFLDNLKGVTDPEDKRKIIGKTFIEIFDRAAKEIGTVDFLAQGTLYPDVIESETKENSGAAKIKTHHNVGGLPETMKLHLVEPVRYLFKDEVREVGKSLGMPMEMLMRQPFPGPGLAIRIIGEITAEKLRMVRDCDWIVMDEIKQSGMYYDIWQSFAVLTDTKTVGVMGDYRTYGHVVAIRAVTSDDAMTADWVRLPYANLTNISNRIVNEVPGVNRVVLDITSKPPGTIEWE